MSYNHPEWQVDNSLTAPADRAPKSDKPTLTFSDRVLTDEELKEAVKEQDNRDFVKRFPMVERKYADPVLSNQKIGLISFVPAKGATPDKDGIYGFAKLRGNFETDREACERSEHIIKYVDSYHKIYHAYVGRPFPLTLSSKWSAETNEVDVKNSMIDSISNSVKSKRNEEQKQMEEIKEREKMLMEDVKKDKEDPLDHYITLKVKKAQLTWSYLETEKKLQEMRDIVNKTRIELDEMDREDPSYKEAYFKKYAEARKASGLDTSTLQDNFIKYMVEDVDINTVLPNKQ